MSAKNSVDSVRMAMITEMPMTLPALPEQQKIATFLTAIDEKIQQLSRQKALLEQYKKGVMQQIFSRELRFRDEGGREFGEWEVRRLGEVAKVYQPKTISQDDLFEEGFLVYGANGIIGRYNQFNHEQEQIAVTCRGNTCGEVTFTEPKSWITGNAMVVNLDENHEVLKRFVYYVLKFSDFTYLITGSGQPQITGEIKKHKIPLTSLPEQQKIADFLTALDEKIARVKAQVRAVEGYKKGLLQGLFV